MPEWAVQLESITKRYGSRTALDQVSIKVQRGSVYALLGANGAGKTTLFRLLLGLVRPDAGRGEVLGCSFGPGWRPGTAYPSVALRARIGYVPERSVLYGRMTAEALLALARDLNPRWEDRIVRRYLELFSVPLRVPVRRMSAGVRAQLALILAMGGDPDLLILDEPTRGLDALHRHRYLQALLADTVDGGRTVATLRTTRIRARRRQPGALSASQGGAMSRAATGEAEPLPAVPRFRGTRASAARARTVQRRARRARAQEVSAACVRVIRTGPRPQGPGGGRRSGGRPRSREARRLVAGKQAPPCPMSVPSCILWYKRGGASVGCFGGLVRRGARRVHASAATARGREVGSRESRGISQPIRDTGRASPVASEARFTAVPSRPEMASGSGSGPVTLDDIRVSLGPFDMSMRRWFTSVIPHEASIVIPHAELRMRKGRGVEEAELILESITIVHSPRHHEGKPGRAAESRE